MTAGQRVTPRERARSEMIDQIKSVAREHLAVDGPNLSLRAVAREIGVVSSAVYRYFASRDDLLTALIVDAYNDLADAVERAESAVPRHDFAGRWRALGTATRDWAVTNPPEYALIYGSPVPGYAAPMDTVGPASRTTVLLGAFLRDANADGVLPDPPAERIARSLRSELKTVAAMPDFDRVPVGWILRGMAAWTLLFGLISFELFGRLNNVIEDHQAYFDHQWRSIAGYLGLAL